MRSTPSGRLTVESGDPDSVFGGGYAEVYDTVYAEKDYEAECALIEGFFREYGERSVQRVLDIGCGTGNHAVRLAQRSYEVFGVEPAHAMLEAAQRKAFDLGLGIRFVSARLQDAGDEEELIAAAQDRPFDAALLMSTVLGYVASNRDIVSGLSGVRRLLRRGAVLIADVWFGPAVLATGPNTRVRAIAAGGRRILRIAEGHLDLPRQVYRTDVTVMVMKEAVVESETKESHDIRFFFPQELDLIASASGFDLLGIHGFPDASREPDATKWPAVMVARAR